MRPSATPWYNGYIFQIAEDQLFPKLFSEPTARLIWPKYSILKNLKFKIRGAICDLRRSCDSYRIWHLRFTKKKTSLRFHKNLNSRLYLIIFKTAKKCFGKPKNVYNFYLN
jgi:hypothetical protein